MNKQSKACPYCNLAEKDQHSNLQSGLCDGLRSGVIAGGRADRIKAAIAKGSRGLRTIAAAA